MSPSQKSEEFRHYSDAKSSSRILIVKQRQRLLERILAHVLRRLLLVGSLEVRMPSGSLYTFVNTVDNSTKIRLGSKLSLYRLMLAPSMALGEGVMDGNIVIERDSVYDLLDLLSRNLSELRSNLFGLPKLWSIAGRGLHRRNTPKRSRANAAYHYDIDRRLYRLFLDSDLQYSCAYFDDADRDIEEAQFAKKRHIAAKLCIEPGQSVLDIGWGWGGLAIYLAKHCGADVTGVTLSTEQLKYARARSISEKLDHRVAFRLQDYREVPETFQRIVSVGMFEHVGPQNYAEFFSRVAKLLDSNGIMLLHSVGRSSEPSRIDPFIEKYIFPGSYVPSLSELLPSIEGNGLIVTDIEILRMHYAYTLRSWRERFLERRSEALKVYDERFCRMWEYYLAACETGFRYSGLVVFQLQLARSQHSVPISRDYILLREAQLRRAEAQVATILDTLKSFERIADLAARAGTGKRSIYAGISSVIGISQAADSFEEFRKKGRM